MHKRCIVFICCLIFSLALVAGTVFAVDYHQCSNLKQPVFAKSISTADDGGSGTYRGLGYTIEIDGHLSAEYGYATESIEMYLFGKLVFAAIT